uniref:Zona pellucida protein AX 1 n=1 Tax=Cyclopterus lumpus TaxID=8103 RepID=A0A8C3ASN1_CYCLU
LHSDCADNLMRLSLDKALAVGNELEVEAINGTQHIVLTPSLAAQCGYSMESDPWGNTRIYSSLLGCYVDNQDDQTFNVGLRLRMYGPSGSDVVTHDVTQTCSYTRWASREILCDRNYMEVEPVSMVLREAEQAGYGAMVTSTRLVMRSPYNTAETYSGDVSNTDIKCFALNLALRAPHVASTIGLSLTGGVLFNNNVISWHVPRRVTQLVDGSFEILEMHMGINGKRLDRSQMAARGYMLSATDFHIVIEIPVGSPDGHYKSHAPDYQYHISYIVEPMLELLWRTTDTQDNTRYKVLFPITTPLMLQPPLVQENTVPEARVFSVLLGPLLHDVVLRNITFFTRVLTVEESNARGFTVQEHRYSNGTKSINPEPLVTTYFLSLIFGFIILPEETPFAHPVELQASLQDVELPTITGTCDQNQFYISVKYGSQGNNFKAMVGLHHLTPEMADYQFHENSTHLSLVLPYTLITSESLRCFYGWDCRTLSSPLPPLPSECYPNGTMTATAVKVDSVTNIIPSRLTLKDQSCKPAFSDDRFAYFSFSVASCGTTRTLFDHYMLYENEIAWPYNKRASHTSPVGPQYRQTILCYYVVNETQTVGFSSQPRDYEPTAEIGSGQLTVQMRLAHDSLYELFYQAEDYPVVKYLRQPLYFEVELVESTDPNLELILESCWATLDEDRSSLPSWDIIVDRCENPDDSFVTIFHPVVSDARVLVPSHIKRFSMKMFTFTKDEEVLKDEIFVHCDAEICDSHSQAAGSCRGQCVQPAHQMNYRQERKGVKRVQRGTDSTNQRQISSGPIVLTSGQTSE